MEFLNSFLFIVYRSVSAVVVLFLISRLMGSRQISQLTFYDYIVGISIGSIAAMAVEEDIDLVDMAVSMLVFGGFAILLSFLTDKSIILRRGLTGKPSILIYNGKIIEHSLKKNKYDINDLLLNCREKGYFKTEEIAFAILESNGQISIMPKGENAPATLKDLNVPAEHSALEYNLIIDGKVLKKNLKCYGKDEQWLKKKLKAQNVNNEEEVLLATGDDNDNLKVYLKGETLPHNDFFI